jgi:hypothetical protein
MPRRPLGAWQRLMQLLFSGAIASRAETRGVTAVLGILDGETGEILHQCEYVTPSEPRAPGQKMQFTGYCLAGDRTYACSHTEIVRFEDWPPTEPAGRISIPGFNDLHHCIPWEGGLAVVNTGLETVDLVSLEGELRERWDLLDGYRDAREIDPDVDYRRFEDTKPHQVHANHLWVRQGELWLTQLITRRAVCLTDDHPPITFEAGMPHDGRYIRDQLVFTITKGFVVVVDPGSLEVVASHDLRQMTPGAEVLGWCRGVCEDPRDPSRFFVAFTFTRPTRWREYRFRIRHGHQSPPSRIGVYDVERRELVESFEMTPPESPGYVLFQLDLLPEHLWV